MGKENKMSHYVNADTDYRVSCRKYLEDLVANRDFEGAVRYFNSIRNTVESSSNLESGIILRLGATAFGSSGNLSRALTLIRTAIAILSRTVGESDHSAKAYIVLGDILRDLGKFREAEKAYRDAESIYRRNDNFSGAGDALNRLAGILFKNGRFDGSLNCLLEAVEYARNDKNNRKLAYLFGNIGRVYTLMGKLAEAKENIRMNIELSAEFGDEVELGRAYLSLGYVNIQLGNLNDAEDALERALGYIERNQMKKEEVIYRTYLGELLIARGEIDEADRALTEAANTAAKIAPESFLAARPIRHMAHILVLRSHYRKGLQTANRAMAIMKTLDDKVEIGALYRILAVCYQNLDQADKARECFGQAISILEEKRAKFELADTLAEAGRSNLFTPNQRAMYLCRAEEIYNFAGMKSKAERTGRAIAGARIEINGSAEFSDDDESVKSNFITGNARMKEIIGHLKMLKNSDIPILLTGETGTGKDHLTQYFHSLARPEGPYVAVNCAAVPDTLIESELFGYQKGAFTGAEANRQGLFMAADNGVLLLDEIGELPLMLQAKLLSILETRKLRPLGTSKEVTLDVLVVAATNRNLREMVDAGTFRQDLYYRLAGITFELPSLRERKEDIPYLLEYFMRRFGLLKKGEKPEPELTAQFVGYEWPGNIRQMENKVKQLSVMANMAKDGSIVELARSFFERKQEEKSQSLFEQVESFEKQLLAEALIAAGGNKSEAARMLSIHESTFRAKMKRYDLEAVVN